MGSLSRLAPMGIPNVDPEPVKEFGSFGVDLQFNNGPIRPRRVRRVAQRILDMLQVATGPPQRLPLPQAARVRRLEFFGAGQPGMRLRQPGGYRWRLRAVSSQTSDREYPQFQPDLGVIPHRP